MLSVGVHGIFSLVPLLSFCHQFQNLNDLFLLNVAPYIPPRRIHMKFVSMPVCMWPDAVDTTDQYRLTTLYDTRLVGYSDC